MQSASGATVHVSSKKDFAASSVRRRSKAQCYTEFKRFGVSENEVSRESAAPTRASHHRHRGRRGDAEGQWRGAPAQRILCCAGRDGLTFDFMKSGARSHLAVARGIEQSLDLCARNALRLFEPQACRGDVLPVGAQRPGAWGPRSRG